MNDHEASTLHEQFENLEQQKNADTLGMWVFLATEIMFFGGLFAGYTVYRIMYPAAWQMASRHTSFAIGTINTFVLLTSSLTVVLGLNAARLGQKKKLITNLVLTIILGLAFLTLKGLEYYHHYEHHLLPGYDFVFDPAYAKPAALFMCFYFAMTGIHALHMIIGVGLMGFLLYMAIRNRVRPEFPAPEMEVGIEPVRHNGTCQHKQH